MLSSVTSVFNITVTLYVVGAGHARDKLTRIAEGPIIRGHGSLLSIVLVIF